MVVFCFGWEMEREVLEMLAVAYVFVFVIGETCSSKLALYL